MLQTGKRWLEVLLQTVSVCKSLLSLGNGQQAGPLSPAYTLAGSSEKNRAKIVS